jgi:hypothetical protein
MFWWQPVETYNVNMAISQIFSSKGGNFGHIIFHKKKKKKKKNLGTHGAFIKSGAVSFFEDLLWVPNAALSSHDGPSIEVPDPRWFVPSI